MRRAILTALAPVVAAALWPQAAAASVLISAPYPLAKPCGARIELGVWFRDDGNPISSRRVTMSVRSRHGRRYFRKRVRARRHWRYWHYRPRCGRRYVVRYRNADFGVAKWTVRIHR